MYCKRLIMATDQISAHDIDRRLVSQLHRLRLDPSHARSMWIRRVKASEESAVLYCIELNYTTLQCRMILYQVTREAWLPIPYDDRTEMCNTIGPVKYYALAVQWAA